jgi:hypothetical protein
MILPGDQWMSEGHIPTQEDARKYVTTGARILIEIPCYGILETQFLIARNGLVKIMTGWMSTWFRLSEIRVIDLMPLPPLVPVKKKKKK